MRILFVAADKMEYAGLLPHATGAHPALLNVSWSREVRLGAHAVLLVANGAGATRAAAAVDAACPAFHPEAVVSTGFCGALDPSLSVASVVVATSVRAEDADYPALPVLADSAFCAGPIRSIGHVARTAEEKRYLRAGGACAVEMEAAGVATRALALGLPFHCIRTVTDLADETLHNDFNKALRPDGHFDTISIVASALRFPALRLPELFRLRRRCVSASRALGSFLANCRF
jgi:adenosylhomocysteine nucleosidase